MIPEKFPEFFPGANPHQSKEFFVHNCDLIICISETTRKDLIDTYGPIAAPIRTVHIPVGPPFTSNVERSQRPRWLPVGPYAIFVGNRAKYKDFKTALKGLALSSSGPKTLLCVGGGRLTAAERQQIGRLGGKIDVVRLDLSDEELAFAYTHAEFYLSTSRYEGFGIPTLEATAVGCRVLLSDNPAHREVGGEEAFFFPASDYAALAESIDSCLRKPRRTRPVISAQKADPPTRPLLDGAREIRDLYKQLME